MYDLTVKKTITKARSLYLPVEEDAFKWGLYIRDCGYNHVNPGVSYPDLKVSHPGSYLFSWNKGRILDEYQLVYISEGRGIFESEETGLVRIEAGKVFLLFPGVWHRFRPIKKVGWTENWIGFEGDIAERIMKNFFSPKKAILGVGANQELLHLILSVCGVMTQSYPGYQQIAASRTIEALAIIRSSSMKNRPTNRDSAQKVQQAREYLGEHLEESIDMNKLAKSLGLSYSRFRSIFKEQTGTAPHQYQIDIRLNKARYLLSDSNLSISRVAEILGFSSAYYFSRLFKDRNGSSPSAYRSRI